MGLREFTGRLMLRGAAGLLRPSMAASPAYDAAGTGVRLKGWDPTSSSLNSIVGFSGGTLRRRTRDMVRKNPYAERALTQYVSSCIGTGIKPKPQHPNDAVAKQLLDAWNRWNDESDADGTTNFYGLQAMALRSMMEGGDVFGRMRARRPGDGLFVPLQIQLLESEMVPYEETKSAPGNIVKAGVEFDAVGRRVAYRMLREHPGEAVFGSLAPGIPIRVPAENVIHVFRPLRPGQVRGVPALATALLRLYELDQYDDAELARKKLAAMFTGFITKRELETGGPTMGSESTRDATDTALEIAKLQPGTFPVLGDNEDVSFANSPEIGAGTADFLKHMLRSVAAGAGVTYEQLTNDLSDVNYSSIRAGILEFRRECEQFQSLFFVHQMCRPIWRRFVRDAILAGRIDASDFNENAHLYYDVRWVSQGFKWVDPLKEIQALIRAIRAGLISRSEAVRLSGYDPDLIDRELESDRKRAERHGLVLDSDPSHVSAAGLTQARTPGSVLPDPFDDGAGAEDQNGGVEDEDDRAAG